MDVILLERVEKLGQIGDVVTVLKDGRTVGARLPAKAASGKKLTLPSD